MPATAGSTCRDIAPPGHRTAVSERVQSAFRLVRCQAVAPASNMPASSMLERPFYESIGDGRRRISRQDGSIRASTRSRAAQVFLHAAQSIAQLAATRHEFASRLVSMSCVSTAASLHSPSPTPSGILRTHTTHVTPYSSMFSKETLALMQAAVDAIIVIDHRGRMAALNDAAWRMFGYRLDELLAENVSMLMPEPDRGAHDGYLARYLETGKAGSSASGAKSRPSARTARRFPRVFRWGASRMLARHASWVSCATCPPNAKRPPPSSWSATAPTPTSNSTTPSADARYRAAHRRNQRAR